MRAKVNANGVRLYEHNSTLSAAKGFLAYGEEIEISAEYGDWCQLADGRWVEACYTEAIDVSGGGADVDLSAYATKDYVNEMLGVIENGSY